MDVQPNSARALAVQANNVEQGPEAVGKWESVFNLPNVAIHTHVLPNGKVLFWGRRDHLTDSLDVHECTPFVWDPATNETVKTPQPMSAGTTVNLFCSGHTFLPDGKLLVVGGHLADSQGLNQSCVYDWATNTWTPSGLMNDGRWYPTAVTLADGSALVSSGSFLDANLQKVVNNNFQQVWENGEWRSIVTFDGLPLFPRMHVAPDGRLFMSGTNADTFFLDATGQASWTKLANGSRASGSRDYAPSVMYDVGKVLYIGGGHEPNTLKPTNETEFIDLNDAAPVWASAGSMSFARRQHNATILPDGTVLVTGGTRGGGGLGGGGFNDLTPGQPVHVAELWDPASKAWTQMAAEDIDRCYHATAVLLPDATVLSAGGGEYRPIDSGPDNDPKDSHRNGQIYSPPYLFKGARPDISVGVDPVVYGQTFVVTTSDPDSISLVSWIRLPSVTHSFDQNQRINFLPFVASGGVLTVTAPLTPEVCPPGHYMLFVLNQVKVPSVAAIVKIVPAVVKAKIALNLINPLIGTVAKDVAMAANATGTRVVVGITPSCPYGLSACWGGAFEALKNLHGVDAVQPIPDAADSVAYVYLQHDGLPDLANWPDQFKCTANGTYRFRGVEVTLRGTVTDQDGTLVLDGTDDHPPVVLAALQPVDRIQWDHRAGALKGAEEAELSAYGSLQILARESGGTLPVTITGPLKLTDDGFVLPVREYQSHLTIGQA